MDAQIIFPISGRGIGHVSPTIIGIRSNISSKLLELVTSNFVCGFVLPLLFDCRVLRTIFTVRQYTVGYPSDSLASCFGTNRFLIIIRLPVGCQ